MDNMQLPGLLAEAIRLELRGFSGLRKRELFEVIQGASSQVTNLLDQPVPNINIRYYGRAGMSGQGLKEVKEMSEGEWSQLSKRCLVWESPLWQNQRQETSGRISYGVTDNFLDLQLTSQLARWRCLQGHFESRVLNPNESHPERISDLRDKAEQLRFTGIEFLMKLNETSSRSRTRGFSLTSLAMEMVCFSQVTDHNGLVRFCKKSLNSFDTLDARSKHIKICKEQKQGDGK